MDLIGRRKVGRQVLESASTGLLGVTDKRLRHSHDRKTIADAPANQAKHLKTPREQTRYVGYLFTRRPNSASWCLSRYRYSRSRWISQFRILTSGFFSADEPSERAGWIILSPVEAPCLHSKGWRCGQKVRGWLQLPCRTSSSQRGLPSRRGASHEHG